MSFLRSWRPASRSLRAPLLDLVWLRWVAVVAQSALIVAVMLVWDAELPLVPLFGLLALTAVTNVAFGRVASSAPESWVGPVLLVDVLILTALLALTGGPANPFSVLYLVHVMLAAIMAGTGWTWLIVVASAAGFGLLFLAHIPLPPELGGQGHHGGHAGNMDHAGMGGHQPYSAHLQAMWVAYTISAITIAAFVSRLAQSLRQAREERARAARLLGLATLAAGAAHEIGNPLATIRVAASELEEQLASEGAPEDVLGDLRLINAEVSRAHAVLERMAVGAGELVGENPTPARLEALLTELVRQLGVAARRVELRGEMEGITVRWPIQAASQALQQLLRNALQASSSNTHVRCEAQAEGRSVVIVIRDEGVGMSPQTLEHIGEPFFTTKGAEGMGLGVFIARSLIEHLGGTMQIDSTEGKGTSVSVRLPATVAK